MKAFEWIDEYPKPYSPIPFVSDSTRTDSQNVPVPSIFPGSLIYEAPKGFDYDKRDSFTFNCNCALLVPFFTLLRRSFLYNAIYALK